MSDAPPVIPPPLRVAKSGNWFQQMARASWMAPIIAIAVNFLLIGVGGGPGKPNAVQGVFGALFILGGLVLGIIALFGITKYGKGKILIPALIGIFVNLSLIVLGALPIILLKANRLHLQPVVHITSATSYKNDNLHFSLDIPSGFRDFPEGKQSPNIEQVFIKGVVGGGEVLTVINIERMNGLIPRNKPLKKEELPIELRSRAELTSRNWRGAKVDTIVAHVNQNGAKMIIYTIQVPLKPSAIQLNVGGPESKQDEVSQLADDLLASLDGETNW
jgi:hypothetical protein